MAILSGFACAPVAQAQYQWTAIPLNPDGAYSSEANGADGRLQIGGIAFPGQIGRAALWDRSADSWTDLTPDWAVGGVLRAAEGGGQAGQMTLRQANHYYYYAAVFRGTPESAVNLHPAEGYTASDVNAVAGEMQVGTAAYYQTGYPHAALWTGTPDSFVDLHPDGISQSHALATDGVLQGGWASLPGGGNSEAVIWSGSAESIVNLAPDGALESSVNAMAPGVQVGYYGYQGENRRAAMWRGTAESFVDIAPPGSIASEILASTGTMHAGYSAFAGFNGAGIWMSDDPASFVNLHELLPPEYYVSEATDISVVGSTIYVTGTARWGPSEAWLWIGTVPAPGSCVVLVLGLGVLSNHRRRR